VSAENEVRQLENDWYDALKSKDPAKIKSTLGQILADDYTNTDSKGNVWRKEEDIANCTDGTFQVDDYQRIRFNVRVYGKPPTSAIVNGSDTLLGARFQEDKPSPTDVSGSYVWSDMWVKTGSTWQCAASHGSEVPESSDSLSQGSVEPKGGGAY